MRDERPDGPHDWYRPQQYAYPICRICGVVMRRDGKNKPCKGPTRLRDMETCVPADPGAKE